MRLSGEGENVLTTPETHRPSDPHRRSGARRRSQAHRGRARRAVAGRQLGPLPPPCRRSRRRAARSGLCRIRPVRQRLPNGCVLLPDDQAGPGPASRWRHAGSAHQPDDPGSRHAQPDLHPAVLRRRARGQRLRSRCCSPCRSPAVRRWSPRSSTTPTRRYRPIDSTSAIKATTKPSSSTCEQ